MRLFPVILLAAVLPSLALADAMKGAQLSASCAHCHGTDGNSSSGQYPTLAGQTPEYSLPPDQGLQGRPAQGSDDVADGRYPDRAGHAGPRRLLLLTERRRGSFKPDPTQVAEGKKIVEEAKCNACHPPSFKGAKEVPRLTRQKYPYLVKQLKDYRDGVRTNDDGLMAPSVKGLTDAQIDAIAQYISSL